MRGDAEEEEGDSLDEEAQADETNAEEDSEEDNADADDTEDVDAADAGKCASAETHERVGPCACNVLSPGSYFLLTSSELATSPLSC